MSRKQALLALAERLERASGPDRSLDFDIARTMGWTEHTDEDDPVYHARISTWWKEPDAEDWSTTSVPPYYSASIDAAASLIPEGVEVGIHFYDGHAWIRPSAKVGPHYVIAATPALALAASALKAIAALENDDEG